MTSECDPEVEKVLAEKAVDESLAEHGANLDLASKKYFEKMAESMKKSQEKGQETEKPVEQPKPVAEEKPALSIVVSQDNDKIAQSAWQAYWGSLKPEQRQAIVDMFKQDLLMVEHSVELDFDPRGTVRLARTPKKDDQGRPIFALTSPDPEIGKDVLSSMEGIEYTIHNKSTGGLKFVDLTDRKRLESKPEPSSEQKGSEAKKEEVKK
jgi:hypothetical protein